jgi:ribosome modulation factor
MATDAYFEGRKAFAAGVAFDACPYEDGIERAAWQRGWTEARRESETYRA